MRRLIAVSVFVVFSIAVFAKSGSHSSYHASSHSSYHSSYNSTYHAPRASTYHATTSHAVRSKGQAGKGEHVRGYRTKNGKYVHPYNRHPAGTAPHHN